MNYTIMCKHGKMKRLEPQVDKERMKVEVNMMVTKMKEITEYGNSSLLEPMLDNEILQKLT